MSRSRRIPPASFLLVALVATGCTFAKISGRGTTPLLLNDPADRVTLVEHFRTSKRITFDYTGAFDASEVLSDVMQGKQADAVANMVVTVKTTFGDALLNIITLGIANARTLEVEGDLVRREGVGGSADGDSDPGHGHPLEGAGKGGQLMVKMADFSGRPESSPILLRSGGGWAMLGGAR
jgi:hypothetical protein